MDFFERLRAGLARTREGWEKKLAAVFRVSRWDEETFATVEEILISADVGVRATQKLLDAMRRRNGGGDSAPDFSSCLQDEMVRILTGPQKKSPEIPQDAVKPWVVMFVGVNGVGKTTTIGKLAARKQAEGKEVLLVAGDTFRAAAIEQLEVWGRRLGLEVIKHQSGQDPSGVVFDAMRAAKKRGTDVVLIDTAGRLHTKIHLLEELKKMRRIIAREYPGAPHECLLVLDASTGQNALQQAKVFKESLEITGIVLAKLDGTAKGGVVVGVREELGIPVQYIGVGEGIDDLHPFDPVSFVRALFG
ncbi:MAG: signal recognition particle-docking protein FtsY [Candidatus Binatia bacterium]